MSGASADWQYTKWGMTEDQVVAASQRSVIAVAGGNVFSDGSTMRLQGTYESAAGKFGG
jgi:hypothetical protein